MGDEDSNVEIITIGGDDYIGNITISDYYDYAASGFASDANYPPFDLGSISLDGIDWATYNTLGVASNNITLTVGGEEMIRVSKDGFYVRGVKVEADEKEAKHVYEAFKQWMTWAVLNGELKN